MPEVKDTTIALQYKALAHPRRARIFRLLTEQPEIGQSYTHLQTATQLCSSSLVHHLREMERCGLIRRQRKGPIVRYFLTTHGLASASRDVLELCTYKVRPSRHAA